MKSLFKDATAGKIETKLNNIWIKYSGLELANSISNQ